MFEIRFYEVNINDSFIKRELYIMKNHKYKLATLVLSTGLLLGACGDAGEEQPAEEQADDTTVEETEDTSATEDTESTEETPDDTSEEETSGDTADSEGSVEDNSSDGTGGSDDGETDTAEEDSGSSDGSNGSSDGSGVAVLDELGSTPEEAVSAAQENFDGELTELELDDDNGQWVYKVHLQNDSEEYEVDLSADDLSASNEETESDNDNNDTEDQFSYGDAIPHDEAVQTALDEVGGELEGWSLDKDDGQLQYDVEVTNADNGNDTDVTINAESGEVMEVDN